MTTTTPDEILADASTWWSTSIVDIRPGKIAIRGYPIEELIGTVSLAEMVWLMLRGELPTRAQAEQCMELYREIATEAGEDADPTRAVGLLAYAWEQKQQGGRIKGPMPKSIPYRYTGPSRSSPPLKAGRGAAGAT